MTKKKAAEATLPTTTIVLEHVGAQTMHLTIRDGKVVGAMGADPSTWIGLSEEAARHRAAFQWAIDEARDMYANDTDDIEIDDGAEVSDAREVPDGDGGVWVQAWVWVPADRCPVQTTPPLCECGRETHLCATADGNEKHADIDEND